MADDLVAQRPAADRVSLGEILIAQGAVSRAQLRACLRRQWRLRWCAAAFAMLLAPWQQLWADRDLALPVGAAALRSWKPVMSL